MFGAFGLVQVHVIEVSLDGVGLAVALIVVVLVGGAVAYLLSRRQLGLPENMPNLRGNRARRNRSFEVVQKRCDARIAPGESPRRDVSFLWTMRVRNRGARPLPMVDLALLGEVPAFEHDLVVQVKADGERERFEIPVDRRDRLSPTISVPLPAPGLAPGGEAEFSFEYEWPAIAHLTKDCWVFDVGRIPEGGVLELALAYPPSVRQLAEGRVIRRQLGLDRKVDLGRLPTRLDERTGAFVVEFRYTIEPHDDILLVFTRLSNEVGRDPDPRSPALS